jgi:branched-subunit amino acid ABC-type transport system permease component
MGIGVRASAENGGARRSSASVKGSTIVWALAAVCHRSVCSGPLIGINLTGNTGLSVLLFGLAVAVMAKMDSMPMAFGVGLLIGDATKASSLDETGRRSPTP